MMCFESKVSRSGLWLVFVTRRPDNLVIFFRIKKSLPKTLPNERCTRMALNDKQ